MRRRTAGNSVGGAGAPKDVIASESEASDVPHRGYAADSDGDSGASDFGSEVGERAPALKDEKDICGAWKALQDCAAIGLCPDDRAWSDARAILARDRVLRLLGTIRSGLEDYPIKLQAWDDNDIPGAIRGGGVQISALVLLRP